MKYCEREIRKTRFTYKCIIACFSIKHYNNNIMRRRPCSIETVFRAIDI